MRKQFGAAFAETYFSSAAIIIESALPYALFGIAFVISYGVNSGVTFFFLLIYTMFMVSARFLVLLCTIYNQFPVSIASDAHPSSGIRKGME